MRDKFYTTKALAELFDKHENTIYRWIVEDQLFPNAFKVKDGWFVPFADVKKLIKSGRLNAEAGEPFEKPQPKPVRATFVNRWRT